jgi:DNA recombination protein RmuC
LHFQGAAPTAAAPAPPPAQALAAEPADVAKVFGPPIETKAPEPVAVPVAVVAVVDPATRFALSGVVASLAPEGVALLSVEGRPARPYRVGAIIDNVLTPDQYAKNVKTVPDSNELVEFAIRLPGRDGAQPVWLPIDAKYPVEHYQRLQNAMDEADKAGMAAAGQALESSIRGEARKIAAKYVAPPHTTDFAIMYLPTEGLFAEVMRRPGLVEAVQNECRVVITGPANLAAMLNSLQMGFKTLAIEQRSSEVWGVLGQVKTEFAKFGEVVEATRKSIDAAAKKFEQVDVRTRAIQRKLRDVQELPDAAALAAASPAALPQGRAPSPSLGGVADSEDE